MANKTIVPEGKFKIITVGPTRNWTFKADNGDIEMTTYSVQLEGHESIWVDLNQKADSAAPTGGQEIEGKIEQDEAGKYAPRFKKASGGRGGSWGGGGGNAASPGAIWSATFATAAAVVDGFLQNASAEKKKKASSSIDQYLALVEVAAIKLRASINKHAGETTAAAETKPAEKSESESGESASAPAATATDDTKVEIQDLDDSDLGEW